MSMNELTVFDASRESFTRVDVVLMKSFTNFGCSFNDVSNVVLMMSVEQTIPIS